MITDDFYCIHRFIHLNNFSRNEVQDMHTSGFAVAAVTTTDSRLLHQNCTILSYLGTQKNKSAKKTATSLKGVWLSSR